MAAFIHYRFKSAKSFFSLPIEDHFISVKAFKQRILDSVFGGNGKGSYLVIINAQTGYEYSESEENTTLIVKNTSLIIHRQPPYSSCFSSIIVNKIEQSEVKTEVPNVEERSARVEDDLDDFGDDPFAVPNSQPTPKVESDQKIIPSDDLKLLGAQEKEIVGLEQRVIGPPALGYLTYMMTPPKGYVCHRCHVPGHFIQHCPTNGNPNYDRKRAVTINSEVSSTFDEQMEGVSTSTSSRTSSTGDIPAGLYCYLCKQVMKDAVMTSRCCFDTFCDGCIRKHILSKSMCVCKAKGVLVDHLVPNKTVRQTIARLLDSSSSGSSSASTSSQAEESQAPMVHQPVAPPTSNSASSKSSGYSMGSFRQHILQKVAQAANGKHKLMVQDKEQKLHPRSDEQVGPNMKRTKTEFPPPKCMPVSQPAYYGNLNGSQGHLPLVSPQFGF